MSSCQASLSYKRNALGGGCEHKKDALEMRAAYDKVRKELERSEQRDQALTKELLATRANLHEYQRDLHNLRSVFDKSNSERKYLSQQLSEQKEYNSKLEIQISRMENSCQLILELDECKNDNKHLQEEVEQRDKLVQNLNNKEQAQVREIESLHRSLDACVFYQGGSKRDGADAVTPSKLREIYYELGKRQADIHALSLSLSEVNAQLLELQESYKQLEQQHSTTEVEVKHVKEYNDQLLQSNIKAGKEVAALEEEAVGLRDCNSKLKDDVSSLMEKLKSSMLGSSEMEEKNQNQINALNATIEELQDNNRHLSERLEALTLSLRHRESVLALTEKRLEVETQRLQEDRQSLAESVRQGEVHSSQIEMLRSNMSNALHANELLARESREMSDAHRAALEALNERCVRAEVHNRALEEQAREREERFSDMEKEREEMVAAFKKSIAAAKGLSSRLLQEQALNQNLKQQLHQTEISMQQVIKAKEQVSYAVLDALYKERSMHSQNKPEDNATGEESPNSTPMSRPPLVHPMVQSTASTLQYEAIPGTTQTPTNNHARQSPPQAMANVTVINSTPTVVDCSESGDGKTDDEQSIRAQEDSLLDTLDKPLRELREPEVLYDKNDTRGNLLRLRREVDMMELKAKTKNKNDDNIKKMGDSKSQLESKDYSSRSHASCNDSTMTTSVFPSETMIATSGKKEKLNHSLFDLVNLDPHVDFGQSPTKPTASRDSSE